MYSEIFLYQYWEKLPLSTEITINKYRIKIIRRGRFSGNFGPDFQDVQIELNGVVYRGDVEVHLRSSDWYYHGHHLSEKYNGVILHLVWEMDRERVETSRKHPVPQISFKELIPWCRDAENKKSYGREELFIQRFSRKVAYCDDLLRFHLPEDVLWILLARTLGYRRNSDTMELFARVYYPSRLRNFIAGPKEVDDYFEFAAFRNGEVISSHRRYGTPRVEIPWRDGGRPANHPRKRVKYLAALLKKWWYNNLYEAAEKILTARREAGYVIKSVESLLNVSRREGRPGRERILLFLINWLLPLFYAVRCFDPGMQAYLLGLYADLPPEKISSSLRGEAITLKNAMESQAFYESREMDSGEHRFWLEELKIPYGI